MFQSPNRCSLSRHAGQDSAGAEEGEADGDVAEAEKAAGVVVFQVVVDGLAQVVGAGLGSVAVVTAGVGEEPLGGVVLLRRLVPHARPARAPGRGCGWRRAAELRRLVAGG